MAASRLRLVSFKLTPKLNINRTYNRIPCLFLCTSKPPESDGDSKQTGSFAEFFQKETEVKEKLDAPPEPKPSETFASLLRNSKFMDLGDPEGKIVIGTIYHVVEDDLYIDFGWKFPTVCTRPSVNKEAYVKGAKVKLSIKDLELTARFLGGTKDVTLLEADCVLRGLAK